MSGSLTRASRLIVGGDSAQPRKLLRVPDRPFQIFRRAPQQSGPVPEIAEPEIARQAEQAADGVSHGTMIHAEPVAEFPSADRAPPLLALKHGRIFLRRYSVLAFEPGCGDLVPIVRVVGIALAVVLENLASVTSVVAAIPRKDLFAVLRIFGIALAPALDRGERRRRALAHILAATACTLLGTAPLAPALFARALAVAGHELMRRPNAETRARTDRCPRPT